MLSNTVPLAMPDKPMMPLISYWRLQAVLQRKLATLISSRSMVANTECVDSTKGLIYSTQMGLYFMFARPPVYWATPASMNLVIFCAKELASNGLTT